MPKCNCNAQACGCVLREGENVTVTGSGTVRDPWVIGAAAAEEGTTGFRAGDRKETYRQDAEAGWLDENGQAVSRVTYAALFGVIGTRFGAGDGVNTFNIPNATGRTSVGIGAGFAQDAIAGNTTTTLTVDNLPPHVHTMVHTHSITHNHNPFQTPADEGGHNHNGDLRIKSVGLDPHTHNAPNAGGQTSANGGTNNANSVARGDQAASGDGITTPLTWSVGGDHRHTINVPAFTGSSGASSASNTGSVGAGQSFSNMPPYRAVRSLIKT